MNIWYVEDSYDQFLTLREYFSMVDNVGSVTLHHLDGLKTLSHFIEAGKLPRLLICDNSLPEGNFIEQFSRCSTLLTLAAKVPIIVYSAEPLVEEKAKQFGLFYVQKQGNLEPLVALCRDLLSHS